MTLFQQIDRMEYIHDLIYNESTGSPDSFARKLRLNKRQLFNILEEMRIMGVDIRYDRTRKTYCYCGDKYLHISCSLKNISDSEAQNIHGGVIFRTKCNFISFCSSFFSSVI